MLSSTTKPEGSMFGIKLLPLTLQKGWLMFVIQQIQILREPIVKMIKPLWFSPPGECGRFMYCLESLWTPLEQCRVWINITIGIQTQKSLASSFFVMWLGPKTNVLETMGGYLLLGNSVILTCVWMCTCGTLTASKAAIRALASLHKFTEIFFSFKSLPQFIYLLPAPHLQRCPILYPTASASAHGVSVPAEYSLTKVESKYSHTWILPKVWTLLSQLFCI